MVGGETLSVYHRARRGKPFRDGHLHRGAFFQILDLLHAALAERLFADENRAPNVPKRSGEYLFEIVMRRYQVRSTIMTSNRPLEDWGKLLGDVPAATAILDRFLHNADVITITGRSYRLKDRAGKPAAATEKSKSEPACEPVEK